MTDEEKSDLCNLWYNLHEKMWKDLSLPERFYCFIGPLWRYTLQSNKSSNKWSIIKYSKGLGSFGSLSKFLEIFQSLFNFNSLCIVWMSKTYQNLCRILAINHQIISSHSIDSTSYSFWKESFLKLVNNVDNDPPKITSITSSSITTTGVK